jgi:hypothetical protein
MILRVSIDFDEHKLSMRDDGVRDGKACAIWTSEGDAKFSRRGGAATCLRRSFLHRVRNIALAFVAVD